MCTDHSWFREHRSAYGCPTWDAMSSICNLSLYGHMLLLSCCSTSRLEELQEWGVGFRGLSDPSSGACRGSKVQLSRTICVRRNASPSLRLDSSWPPAPVHGHVSMWPSLLEHSAHCFGWGRALCLPATAWHTCIAGAALARCPPPGCWPTMPPQAPACMPAGENGRDSEPN